MFNEYITGTGCTLEDLLIEGKNLTAVIARDGKQVVFRYYYVDPILCLDSNAKPIFSYVHLPKKLV